MPRNISFAMTTPQVLDQTKDFTRRFGWWFIKPGDVLYGVKKGMGLKKGEKVERLCEIEVVRVNQEPLNAITQADVIREGFPDMTPAMFVKMLVDRDRIAPNKLCNRIEFRYRNKPGEIPMKKVRK